MTALLLALQLLFTSAPETMPGQTPYASGAPRFVQIVSITGVPSDSSAQSDFETAFRGVFMEDQLAGERESGGEWKAGLPLPNRFRLLEGDVADDAWTIEVSIGAPPPLRVPPHDRKKSSATRTVATRRMSRGMIAGFLVRVPDPNGGTLRTVTVRRAFAFPAKSSGDGVALAVPSTGYEFPWGDAGRIAALLALEALHQESGDLVAGERMDISPAVRADTGR